MPKTASTANSAGDIDFETSDNKFIGNNGTVSSPFVLESTTATLTNKSMDGTMNTFTNLPGSAITGTVAIVNGGTGQTGANAAFNALSPMTTGGDLIYGGASGIATRLANGSAGQVLTSAGTTLAPTWSTPSPGFVNPMTSVGDMIIGGTAGAATRLAATTNGFILTLSGGSPAWVANSGGSAPNSVGTFNSQTPSANGLTIASNTLYAQSASASNPGMVNTGAQIFAGEKTFNNALVGAQISTPSNPSSGFDKLYFKSDDNLYSLNSSGVETLIGIGGVGGTLYASSQVTTQSSTISSTSFVTFSNSPALTFTPTVTGTYRVYASATLYTTTTGILGNSRIFNTSGGATLLYENQGAAYNGNGTDISSVLTESIYTLTSGTSYVFDLQGKQTSGSGVALAGNFGPFYMFAEPINSIVGGGSGANTALSNLASVAINTDLLPGTDQAINIGSSSFRYNNVWASQYTSGTNNLQIFTATLSSGSSDTTSATLASGSIAGSGTGATGQVQVSSGNISNASDTHSTGQIFFQSGLTSGSGNTGNVNIASGNSTSGSSGNILISTGTAGVTKGNIQLNAAVVIGATSTTPTHKLNTSTATNASNTLTLTNAPSGISGNPAGYITITINGVASFLPYWQ